MKSLRYNLGAILAPELVAHITAFPFTHSKTLCLPTLHLII